MDFVTFFAIMPKFLQEVVANPMSDFTVLKQGDEVIVAKKGADLSGRDLSNVDLTGADLEGANLENAILARANLADANLRDANLRGAVLREADLRGANLEGAELTGADLSAADLLEVNADPQAFDKANVTGALLSTDTMPGDHGQ